MALENNLYFYYMSISSTTNIEILENKVSLLSPQQVEELDVSSALRCIGHNNNLINEVNKEMAQALMAQLQADTGVMRLRELKRALIQNQKSLSVIAVRA